MVQTVIKRLVIIFIGAGLAVTLASVGFAQPRQPLRLTLQEALAKAATVNLQLIMANARVQEALARISQAQAPLLPQIDGSVNGQHRTSDLRSTGIHFPGLATHLGPFNTFDARGRISMAIFDPGAFERLQAARKGSSLSQADLAKVREDVLALTASLYIDAQRKAQDATLMQIVLARDQMALNVQQIDYSQGTGSFLGLKSATSDKAQTLFLYQQAQNQASEARLDLVAALQLPLDQVIIFEENPYFEKQLQQAAMSTEDQSINANIVLAQAQLEAQKTQRAAARADFLPKLSAEADYGWSGESPSNSSNTYTLGLQATIPIWEGGLQQGQLKEAQAQVQESEAALKDAQDQAAVQIAIAETEITQTQTLVQAKEQQMAAVRKALSVAQGRLDMGTGSALDLARAKAVEALAQDEYDEAQAASTMSLIDLLHAQGRLRSLVATHSKMTG